jgi:hypothetical protein
LKHEVKIEIDKDGNMLDDSDYEYETSKIVDKEGNKFKIEISGDRNNDYFETNENESKLKIIVHRSKINKDSNPSIKFDAKLVDEKGKESPSYSFEVSIDILIAEPNEEKVEEELDDEPETEEM